MGRSLTTPMFISGGGEMGKLINAYDWATTSLGDINSWPQSLQTTLSILLQSKFPMFLYWGPELICFYNDAYRPSLGNEGKHPLALGSKAKDIWPEIWDVIYPLIKQVLNGEGATWSEDQLIPIYRNGQLENVYWTYSYSPVTDETGKQGGVFVTCTETTQKVVTFKKMEETRDLYSFSIDAAELATWDLNPTTYKFSGNYRLKEWFGLQPEEEIDLLTATNNISENYRQKVADAIQLALQFSSGGSYDIKYVIINPITKKERTVRAKGKAFFDNNGNAYRFNGTLQDISNEVHAQEIQQELFTLVENSVDLMSILKMDGRNSYINKAGRTLLGIAENVDVAKIPITNFHTAEQIEFVNTVIIPAVMKTGHWEGVFSICHVQTKEIIPLFNNCHLITDSNTGQPVGIGAVMRDLRPEIASKKELAENEEKLNIAIDASELGMWELSTETNQLICSKKYLEILGFEENAQPTREQFFNCIFPDDVSIRNSAIKRAYIKGSLDFELRIIHQKNKSLRWLRTRAKVFYDVNKRPLKLLGTIMDVTEQKNMAQELEQKVEQRTKQLQQANEELKKMNQELESFAYVASHDLQEPLRKIQTFISRILQIDNETISVKGKEYFDRMTHSAVRMQALINDLLAFSRIGTTEKAFEKIDLSELVEKIKVDLNEDIQKKNGSLVTDHLPSLNVVPYQFRQLFTNLISNALKFSREDVPPEIFIKAEEVDEINIEAIGLRKDISYHHITFSDNGIGFLQDYATRIFEVFQRLNGKSQYEGTGIGLAICKKIVENHNGIIIANGVPNKGATFNIYLPVEVLE